MCGGVGELVKMSTILSDPKSTLAEGWCWIHLAEKKKEEGKKIEREEKKIRGSFERKRGRGRKK
jgi:hypothetical protein